MTIMNYIYLLEILLLLIGLIGGFAVTIKYLVRFQRKIDRLLIVSGINAERVKDIESFLMKTTDFHPKRTLDENLLPELNTDFF